MSGLLLIGCSILACGRSASTDGSHRGSRGHPYCTSIPPEYCETYVACCNQAGYPIMIAECEAYLERDCAEQVDRALAEGWHYSADASEHCDIRIDDVVRDCSYLSPWHQERSHAEHVCRGVWSGDGAPGDSCSDASDCQHRTEIVSTCLRTETDSPIGVCASTEVSFLGDPCYPNQVDPPRACMPGLYCRVASEGCAVSLLDGERCASPDECASGDCTDGSCRGLTREGSACAENADCGSDYCEAGICQLEPVASPELCTFGSSREGSVRAGRVASPGRFQNQ